MSPITREQWKSVLWNTLFAFVSGFVTVWSVSAEPLSTTALKAGAVAGIMASIKIVEKLFTQA